MCKHDLAPLLAQKGSEVIPVDLLRVCLKCGMFKIGRHTIKISKDRIDMDQKEIKKIGYLQIPVGTDKYK